MKYKLSEQGEAFAKYLHEVRGYSRPTAQRYAAWVEYKHLPEANRPSKPAKESYVKNLTSEFVKWSVEQQKQPKEQEAQPVARVTEDSPELLELRIISGLLKDLIGLLK